jgi:hypothetical protein
VVSLQNARILSSGTNVRCLQHTKRAPETLRASPVVPAPSKEALSVVG